ncbi:MAG: DUF3368 domain-containing protein [Ktedonobacterales bacterium]
MSNTSPITNLAAVGRLDLLRALYSQIIVPEEARDELLLGGTGTNPGANEIRDESWFVVDHVEPQQRDQLARIHRALDIGEAATLALALARSADLVLLDDKAAREAARALNLAHTGIIGVLLVAKSRGLTPQIKPILADLRSRAGFRLAENVYQDALRRAGE